MQKAVGFFVLSFWVTAMGAASLAGIIAHDGIPVHDAANIIVPVFVMGFGFLMGLLGVSELPK